MNSGFEADFLYEFRILRLTFWIKNQDPEADFLYEFKVLRLTFYIHLGF